MSDQADKEFKDLLIQVKNTISELNKHDSIRVKHWIEKLQVPVNNAVWKQNRNFYLKIMYEMMLDGQLLSPFSQIPPEGALPKLTLYDVPYPIRIKFTSQLENKQNRKTPSCNKTHSQTRKNSSSIKNNILNRRNSFSKNSEKTMQHKKKINFENSGFFTSTNENINNNNTSFFQETIKAHTMRTDQNFISQMDFFTSTNQQIKGKNGNSINFYSRKSSQKSDEDSGIERKGLAILKKTLKLLGEEYQEFSGQIRYKQLLEQIVHVGQQYGEDMRSINLTLKQPNQPQSLESDYQNYTKRIKQNFTQSNNNYKEFMNYLNSLEE